MSDSGQAVEKNITIENILPDISEAERLQARKEAEQTLYEIFVKYSEYSRLT